MHNGNERVALKGNSGPISSLCAIFEYQSDNGLLTLRRQDLGEQSFLSRSSIVLFAQSC